MADGKNTIVVYKDWISIFEKLDDDEAGRLAKHLWRYINDQEPTSDRLIELVFEPIRVVLKRDLKHWEEVCKKRSESGKKGGLKSGETRKQTESNEANALKNEANEADIDIENDIDIDNVLSKDNDIIEEQNSKFNFKKELIALGISVQVASDWLKVRAKKKAANTETAFNSIKKEILKSPISANESITIAVEKNWQGFKAEWIANLQNQSNGQTFKTNAGTKLTGTQKAAEKLAGEVAEKGKRFAENMQNT